MEDLNTLEMTVTIGLYSVVAFERSRVPALNVKESIQGFKLQNDSVWPWVHDRDTDCVQEWGRPVCVYGCIQ